MMMIMMMMINIYIYIYIYRSWKQNYGYSMIKYNTKQLYYKINITEIDTKQLISFSYNYCINTLWKQYACLQNKFFRQYISFLFNGSLKRTIILMGCFTCFVFSNAPWSVSSELKSGFDEGNKETRSILKKNVGLVSA